MTNDKWKLERKFLIFNINKPKTFSKYKSIQYWMEKEREPNGEHKTWRCDFENGVWLFSWHDFKDIGDTPWLCRERHYGTCGIDDTFFVYGFYFFALP